jgi:hypothetical protein
VPTTLVLFETVSHIAASLFQKNGFISSAPSECLQYFTTAIGSVQTFNWKDVATGTSTRQLANQDYYICFRTELVNKQVGPVQNSQVSHAESFA